MHLHVLLECTYILQTYTIFLIAFSCCEFNKQIYEIYDVKLYCYNIN